MVKKELDVLKLEHASLVKQIESADSLIAVNKKSIDDFIALQNSEQALVAKNESELKTQLSDRENLGATVKLLTADLIPYTISAADSVFEKNKRWIKRFDLVMSGNIGETVTIGEATPLSGQTTFSNGYMIFHRVSVSAKIDVKTLGVVLKSSVSQAHMTLYHADTMQLILSTNLGPLVVGSNELAVPFRTIIEPGNYLIGIQGSSGITIGHSSAITGVNIATQNSFPTLPQTLPSLPTTTSGMLNLYMIGDKF